MIKLIRKIPGFVLSLVFGILLGAIVKYLDTVSVDGHWGRNILSYSGDIFTRPGIWVLIGTILAAYSKNIVTSGSEYVPVLYWYADKLLCVFCLFIRIFSNELFSSMGQYSHRISFLGYDCLDS
ncbi:hypothetical protein [Bacillus sp. UMB0728]|uniref:hypothetical protein n=1 Tax=Bacillus sp. UMB0728 TaxID=2066052 RepID=UPI0021528D1C|nr:hypothetical protein [Bacillus sp. UMB0728]